MIATRIPISQPHHSSFVMSANCSSLLTTRSILEFALSWSTKIELYQHPQPYLAHGPSYFLLLKANFNKNV
ncbi:hypothetical protein PAMP_024704 [Pampus punctatissimus]